MESCPTQAVLPLVGLAAEKVIRDQYNFNERRWQAVVLTATVRLGGFRCPSPTPRGGVAFRVPPNAPPLAAAPFRGL
ncbi:MAG: hypothetical protein R6U98_22420 [Pirellulaceae bacterium]